MNNDIFSEPRLHDLGSSSLIMKAIHRPSGQTVAIKKYRKAHQNEYVKREIEIHRSIEHPFIIHFFGSIQNEMETLIFMNFIDSSSTLYDKLKKDGPIVEYEAQKLFSQLICALLFLHNDCKVVHRDLKLENIVVSENSLIQVIDFGLSRHLDKSEMMDVQCGSLPYSAPEILRGDPYTNKVDIWSAGVILFSLFTGEFPFSIGSEAKKCSKQNLHNSNNYSNNCSDFLCDESPNTSLINFSSSNNSGLPNVNNPTGYRERGYLINTFRNFESLHKCGEETDSCEDQQRCSCHNCLQYRKFKDDRNYFRNFGTLSSYDDYHHVSGYRYPENHHQKYILLENIMNTEPEYPMHISQEAVDLLKRMLDRNPETRISASEIARHPWFIKCGCSPFLIEEKLKSMNLIHYDLHIPIDASVLETCCKNGLSSETLISSLNSNIDTYDTIYYRILKYQKTQQILITFDVDAVMNEDIMNYDPSFESSNLDHPQNRKDSRKLVKKRFFISKSNTCDLGSSFSMDQINNLASESHDSIRSLDENILNQAENIDSKNMYLLKHSA
ncbi:hypothetical protein TRFO_38505 [Tritrichomonas foetus]|uniref:Protein kinase domain-containing protein n=1 Tax=Tritrichomonas foetus TaxID=1144522 RepID=A0A1J4JD68_9EUKA|nr:hypothetical protein TRFO_38505 [Tritrichomonas foetus]|eukprot:OHS95365.1 hypothetical protein TRFO_38505 [Tritrichomonas foetus]